MTGIPDTILAMAELRRTAAERRDFIARGNAPADALARLQHLERAAEILTLVSRITYFEAPDPTREEAKSTGLDTGSDIKWVGES